MDRIIHRVSARAACLPLRRSCRQAGQLAVLIVSIGSLAGCNSGGKSFGDDADIQQLIHHIRTSYLRAGAPLEVTTVKIKNTTPISDELFRVEFDADATLVKGTYVQINRVRLLTDAGWDETAYAAALLQAKNLPADVRKVAEKDRPPVDGETRFYRSEGNEGEKLQFDGRCTARWRGTTWNLAELELREVTPQKLAVGANYDLNQYKVSVLPPNSLEFTGNDGKYLTKSLVEKQKKYVAAVTEAAAKIGKETAANTARLAEIAKTGTLWAVMLPDGNRPAQKWFVEFIEVTSGEILKALIRHPTDELRRRVYSGRVLTGTSEIVLEPAERAPSLFFGGTAEILRIRPGADGGFRVVVNEKTEGRLEPTENVAAARPEGELWAELLRRIQPGTQWTGTARTGENAAAPIKLTFVDVKTDGSYVRALGESPLDPYSLIVFEGTANRAGVHGWPIVLKAIDSYVPQGKLRDFFAPGNSTLVLAMLEDRFIGHRGVDALQFASSSKVEPWAGREQVAAKIFAPGVKLTGRLGQEEGTTEVDLTICDVRDNGAYVRAIAQAKDDPFDCVVYEGRFPFNTSMIDGYSLELTKRSSLTRAELLFRKESATTLRLRLALDGSTVLGIVLVGDRVNETLNLKVDEARKAPVSTATAPFADHVRRMLAKASQWRGTLKDLKQSRTAEIVMRVVDVKAADGITVEFTIPRIAGARAVYEGVMQLDDVNVNAYCATLQKTIGGKADTSAMFDSTIGKERELKFSLSSDGVVLYCRTTDPAGERIEQLTLRPVSMYRPPTVGGGTPAGLPATPSGTRPTSGLLRPVTP